MAKQVTLACWAAKTAVTVSQRAPGQIDFAQDDLDSIRCGQAPLGFVVRLARRLDAATTPTTHLMAWGSFRRQQPHLDGYGFLVTLGLGGVAIAVAGGAGIGGADSWTTGPSLPMTIWPPTQGGLRWPPVAPVLDGPEQLKAFHLAMCTIVDGVETPDARDVIRQHYDADD